jgi:membrane fusion protein, multidrug efflux system
MKFRLGLNPAFLVAAFVLAVTPAFPQASPGSPPPVTVARPIVKNVWERDEFTGRFDSAQTVEIRARVNGYLAAVSFRDGAAVKKDDLLFTIDKRTYEAAVEQAQAALSSAQSAVDFAKTDFERANSLGRTGSISEQTIGQRRQSYETAQANWRGAQAALDAAKLNLEFTEIRAPIAGKISRKLITEGNLVTADATLLTTIVSIDPIDFYFDADERTYLGYLRAGLAEGRGAAKPAEVMVQLTDEKEPSHKGVIDFVDNRVDSATGTIRLRAVFPNKDHLLTPGLFGKIYVPGAEPYKGVLVPDEAILADLDRRIVMVVASDGTVSSKTVRPGPKIDGYRVIREGLTGDETIVIAGLQRARAGQKVTPQVQTLADSR